MKRSKKTTYKSAGVNVAAGIKSVKMIKDGIRDVLNKNVLAGIGAFGAMYGLKNILKKYKDPVLVQSIDSVGTKLKIAAMMNRYDTVGMDIVAHSCNDILCQGAKPFTLLDYIATSKVKPKQIDRIISGIIRECLRAGVSLIGGEIAELPGVYRPGEYDLAGSVSGVVEKNRIIDGSKIKVSDVLLGLPSVGLHTNGYSLAREVFFKVKRFKAIDKISGLERSLGEELLIPHKNYTNIILPLLDKFNIHRTANAGRLICGRRVIHGIAHITGGGLIDNVGRILPNGTAARIQKGSWPVLPIFKLIKKFGNVPEKDMQRTFNLGIGMVLVVSQKDVVKIKIALKKIGEAAYEIGEVVEGNGEVVIGE